MAPRKAGAARTGAALEHGADSTVNADAPPPRLRLRAAHLLALSAFAIAQPVFSLLTDKPFYLAVDRFTPAEVIVDALVLLLLPAAVLTAIEVVAQLAHPRLVAPLHELFVGALSAILLYRIFRNLPGNFAIVGALAGAAMLARIYRTWALVRSFVTVCSLAAVPFVALFLVRAPLHELATRDGVAAAVQVSRSSPPVVLVVFDEFPSTSLMTNRHTIDAAHYPNFAALARTSIWYRNATTVHDYTFWAVPAILTGRRPRNDQLPTFADHRQNLFTLLGSTYPIRAFEPVTQLCPVHLCPARKRSLHSRMRTFGVHLRRLLRMGVLAVKDLSLEVSDWEDPPAEVTRFVSAMRPAKSPQLYVAHVLLPHGPWRYLPSGRKDGFISYAPGAGIWSSHTHPDATYVRHLLQVAYVDRVLRKIVRRLQATGLWDQALFIVTADHGVSFRPGEHYRNVASSNVADIALIPLFVKLPGQRRGIIDDRGARSIDIVPTIADVLQIRAPWKFDGRSLLTTSPASPSAVVVKSVHGDVVRVPWRVIEAGRIETIARKTRLLGPARGR